MDADGLWYGGGGGIRTHGTLARTQVFKTCAFNHSATPPTFQVYSYSGIINISRVLFS